MRTKSSGRRLNARLAGALLAAPLALWSLPAGAYCRTSACEGVTGARCTPPSPDDCGTELFWAKPCVSFSMQKDASNQVPLDKATAVFEEAFRTWTEAECPEGGHPRIQVVNLGPVECNQHEYNKKSSNANIILFQDDEWPHQSANSTLALTTVTYSVETGEIYDADMELNSASVDLTIGDKNVIYDLLSIATHETGHFLGLSHSPDIDATMYKDYSPGTTELRSLAADDIAGICAIFKPGDPIPESCDPTPRRGFSSVCSPPPIEQENDRGCCSTAPGAPDAYGAAATAAMALGLMASARRRKRR